MNIRNDDTLKTILNSEQLRSLEAQLRAGSIADRTFILRRAIVEDRDDVAAMVVPLLAREQKELDEALCQAARFARLGIIARLIAAGANSAGTDHQPLMFAIFSAGSLETVKLLVANGADPAARNNLPLRIAAFIDREDIVAFLLAKGASRKLADNVERSWVLGRSSPELVALLGPRSIFNLAGAHSVWTELDYDGAGKLKKIFDFKTKEVTTIAGNGGIAVQLMSEVPAEILKEARAANRKLRLDEWTKDFYKKSGPGPV